jgi:hypothetical protein
VNNMPNDSRTSIAPENTLLNNLISPKNRQFPP